MRKDVRAVALALTLSLMLVGGCTRQHYTDAEHVQRAKDFQAKGDLRASAIELKNALQKNPKNSEARMLLGEIYLDSALGDAAEKELLRAKDLGVGGEPLLLDLGRAYNLQGKFQDALAILQIGPQTSPNNRARFQQIRADALMGLKRNADGCALYQEAISSNPKLAQAYWGLAHCAAINGDIAKSRAELDRALEADPSNVDTLMLIGDLERLRRNVKEAEQAYTQALKINPILATGLTGRALIYIDQKRLDAAMKDIDTLRRAAPDDYRVGYLQALVDFRKGQYPAALDALQQSLKLAPDFAASALVLGLVQHKLGQLEQAETNLSRFLAADPGNLLARKELVSVLLSRDKTEAAFALLAPALKLLPDDPEFLALMGSAYMKQKEYAKATTYFAKATAINNASANLRTDLGISRMVSGDNAQAMNDLTVAALMDPAQYRADIMLALAYLGRKEYSKMGEVLDRIEKKQPNNPITYNLWGALYNAENKAQAARQAYEKSLVLDPAYFPSAMNLANMDLADNHPEQAKKRYQAILAKDKNNLQAYLALAQLAAQEKNEKEYLGLLEKAMRANPNEVQPILLLARYYLQTGKPQRALALAHEAQAANRNSAAALELLGAVELAVGERDNALASFSQAANLAPNTPEIYLQMGGAQISMGRTSDARASLQKALALKPNYLEAMVALASLELGAQRPSDALRVAQSIEQAYPKLAVGYAFEGDAAMQNRQAANAIKAYSLALTLNPDGVLAAKLHQAQTLNGNRKDADLKLTAWLEAHPDDAAARLYLANVYLKEANPPGAVAQLNAILAKNPNNIAALNGMALAKLAAGDGAGALQPALRANQGAPNNPALLTTLARVYLQLNQAAKALPLLENALKRVQDPDVRYFYALSLIQNGDKARGKEELTSLLNEGRPFAEEGAARKLLSQ